VRETAPAVSFDARVTLEAGPDGVSRIELDFSSAGTCN